MLILLFILKVREDELSELEEHFHGNCCHPVKGGVENSHGKINILLQTFISRGNVDSFSLVSDLAYVAQNSSRIVRGLFDIAVRKGWSAMTGKLLTISKCLDHQLWEYEHPLKQFNKLSLPIIEKLEESKTTLDRLKDMTADEIGQSQDIHMYITSTSQI